ncbi:hypothetical protein [Pedococcus bigeumensis]|uniref:hypothetical protein n=1 Tax=Pedococcus bigeumensis TaxID=433644 RepID=UPI002FE92B4E
MDASFDLLSYHYYYSWLFFHGGVGQADPEPFSNRYLNPLAEFPWFLLDAALSPRASTAAIAAVAGVNLALVRRITLSLGTAVTVSGRTLMSLAAMLLAATGAMFSMELGMSLADVVVSIPMLGALLLALSASKPEAPGRRSAALLMGAGGLAGVAVGAKLTMVVYAVALALGVLVITIARRSAWPVIQYAAGGIAGLTVAAGWWYWSVWKATGNPVFPYYNTVFKSPLWGSTDLHDARYKVRGLADALQFPVYMAQGTRRVLDVPVRDVRWSVLAVIISAAVLVVVVRALVHRRGPAVSLAHLLFWTFFVVGGLLWLNQFAIARYAVTTELLTGPAILLALLAIVHRARVVASVGAVLALAMAPFNHGHFRHVPFGPTRLNVGDANPLQSLQPGDVVLADHHFGPSAWLLTHVPAGVTRHVLHVWFDGKPIDARVRAQLAKAPAVYVIVSPTWQANPNATRRLQRYYGLTLHEPCRVIDSNVGTWALCPADYAEASTGGTP